MPAKNGWNCSQCTFEHTFPGTTCVMCGVARVTKKLMSNFVQGIPIPESAKINSSTVSASSGSTVHSSSSSSNSNAAKSKAISNKNAPALDLKENNHPANRFFANQQGDIPTNDGNDKAATSVANNKQTISNPYASSKRKTANDNSSNGSCFKTAISITDEMDPPEKNYNQTTTTTTTVQAVAAASLAPPAAVIAHTATTLHNNNNNKSYGSLKPDNKKITSSHNTSTNNINAKQTSNPKQTSKRGAKGNTKSKRPKSAAGSNSLRSSDIFRRARPPALPYVPVPVPVDRAAYAKWIFPTSAIHEKRDYQCEIASAALFDNTLVSLPTGLGKTLIAAVVMYNYYRWFPTGKIIFCAPTLPLVKQQANAIYDIVGFPMEETAVMTGHISQENRQALWHDCRIFYCTPQTVQNDLNSIEAIIPADQVVCLVLDETHRASGDHAYVKVAELLTKAGAKFRLLGLSATPGSDLKSIQELVDVLNISMIQCRTDEDEDVSKYTHNRVHEKVEVKTTGLMEDISSLLLDLLPPYLKNLQKDGNLKTSASGGTLTSGYIYNQMELWKKDVREKKPNCNPSLYPDFEAVRTIILWRECIRRYGPSTLQQKLTQFELYPKGSLSKIVRDGTLLKMREMIRNAFDDSPGKEGAERLLATHPKMLKLKEILEEHFGRKRAEKEREAKEGQMQQEAILGEKSPLENSLVSTRVIVFSQYRKSVAEIVCVLDTLRPSISPSPLVGQSKGRQKEGEEKTGNIAVDKGMNSNEQQATLQQFKEGTYNVLVCTSIGEEGLDIGQVDLIVLFDCLKSPIRNLQRVGRTGRSRDGTVVSLLTKDELKMFSEAEAKEKTLLRGLKDPNKIKVHPHIPLVPEDTPTPQMQESTGLRDGKPEFSFSLVAGNCGKKLRKSDNKERLTRKAASELPSNRWRLTDQEEQVRRNLLGSRIDQCCESDSTGDIGFPLSLRKRFLKARELSYSSQTPADLSRYTVGNTLNILRTLQDNHGKRYDPSKLAVFRSFTRDEETIQHLFRVKKDSNTAYSILTSTEEQMNAIATAAASASIGSEKSTRNAEGISRSLQPSSILNRGLDKHPEPPAAPKQNRTYNPSSVRAGSENDVGAGAPIQNRDRSLHLAGPAIAPSILAGQRTQEGSAPPLAKKVTLESRGNPNHSIADPSSIKQAHPTAQSSDHTAKAHQQRPCNPYNPYQRSAVTAVRQPIKAPKPVANTSLPATTAVDNVASSSSASTRVTGTTKTTSDRTPIRDAHGGNTANRSSATCFPGSHLPSKTPMADFVPTANGQSTNHAQDLASGDHRKDPPASVEGPSEQIKVLGIDQIMDQREQEKSDFVLPPPDDSSSEEENDDAEDEDDISVTFAGKEVKDSKVVPGSSVLVNQAIHPQCNSESSRPSNNLPVDLDKEANELVLPPPDDSSSEEENDDAEDNSSVTLAGGEVEDSNVVPESLVLGNPVIHPQCNTESISMPCGNLLIDPDKEANELVLPPPDDFSGEEENDDTEDAISVTLGGKEDKDSKVVPESVVLVNLAVHPQCNTESIIGPSRNFPIDLDKEANGLDIVIDNIPADQLNKDVDENKENFELPTQQSSSSEEEESDSESVTSKEECGVNERKRGEGSPPVESGARGDNITKDAAGGPFAVGSSEQEQETDGESDIEDEDDDDDDDVPLISLRKDRRDLATLPPSLGEKASQGAPDTDSIKIPGRPKTKRKVDVFLSQGDSLSSATKTPGNVGASEAANRLVNTPSIELEDTPCTSRVSKQTPDGLMDTPADITCENGDNVDDVACAICLSKDSLDDDPIVFCDGPGFSTFCNLAVHTSCYSIDKSVLDEDEGKPWRCDPCSLQCNIRRGFDSGNDVQDFAQCCICRIGDGPLKRRSRKVWDHPYCSKWSTGNNRPNDICAICSQTGAVQCGGAGCNLAVHPHCAIAPLAKNAADSCWTLLRVQFSRDKTHETTTDAGNEQGLSMVFCHKDTAHGRNILEDFSKGQIKVLIIPPDRFCGAGSRNGLVKVDSRATMGGPRRLKKLAFQSAIQKSPQALGGSSGENQKVAGIVDVTKGKKKGDSHAEEVARRERKRARMESRKRARCFIDEEADIDSDDEGDEAEERDVAAIEAEELSMDNFINDSSQLGYTQCHLDAVDPDASGTPGGASCSIEDDALHRRLDNQRARQNQFATPLLNRKMQRDSLTPSEAPESERGLGKMHFVRSVLEHHRNGGDSDDIEDVYNELEEQVDVDMVDLEGDNPTATVDSAPVAAFEYGF